MSKKNIKKKEIIHHVLDDSCKECVRKVMTKSLLMQDLYHAKGYTLVSLNGSIPYLKAMTTIIEEGIKKTLGDISDDEQNVVFADYFSDIRTLLNMFKHMKDGTVSTDRTTTI